MLMTYIHLGIPYNITALFIILGINRSGQPKRYYIIRDYIKVFNK